MSEVWHARSGIVARGRARGRVRSGRRGSGRGPANLATIRAAVIAAVKNAGYLHVPEGRRDHATPAEALHLHGLD
jgi:hypothetical protein